MHYFIAATLLVVYVIHLLPAIGVLSAARMSRVVVADALAALLLLAGASASVWSDSNGG